MQRSKPAKDRMQEVALTALHLLHTVELEAESQSMAIIEACFHKTTLVLFQFYHNQ